MTTRTVFTLLFRHSSGHLSILAALLIGALWASGLWAQQAPSALESERLSAAYRALEAREYTLAEQRYLEIARQDAASPAARIAKRGAFLSDLYRELAAVESVGTDLGLVPRLRLSETLERLVRSEILSVGEAQYYSAVLNTGADGKIIDLDVLGVYSTQAAFDAAVERASSLPVTPSAVPPARTATAATASEGQTAAPDALLGEIYLTNSGSNVRDVPGGNRVGSVPANTAVRVVGEQLAADGRWVWFRISQPVSGFIRSDLLAPAPPGTVLSLPVQPSAPTPAPVTTTRELQTVPSAPMRIQNDSQRCNSPFQRFDPNVNRCVRRLGTR